MISNLQIFVISIPVLVLIIKDPTTGLFLRAAVIWMNDLFIICVIFGSLMYSVHFGIKNDVNIGSAVQDYAKRERASTVAAKDRKEKLFSRLSTPDSCVEPEGGRTGKRHSSGGSVIDYDVGSTRVFSLAEEDEEASGHMEKHKEDVFVSDRSDVLDRRGKHDDDFVSARDIFVEND